MRIRDVFIAVSTACLSLSFARPPEPAPRPRQPIGQLMPSLTHGEKALARSLFGDEINLFLIRKSFRPASDDRVASAHGRKLMRFYGRDNHSSDYSRDTLELFGTFVHEMTHLVQFQTDGRRATDKPCPDDSKYRYTLDAQSRFADFCHEQQAAIVEDYARRFIHPDRGATLWYPYADTPDSDRHLMRVVEARFPAAAATRRKLDATRPRAPWQTAQDAAGDQKPSVMRPAPKPRHGTR